MKHLMRGFILWAVVALVVLLPPDEAHAVSGDYAGQHDFDLHASNTYPTGITWNGSRFLVFNYNDNNLSNYHGFFAYGGNQNGPFHTITSQHYGDRPAGTAFDGTYHFTTANRTGYRNVRAYTSTGSYGGSGPSWTRTGANDSSSGITWDGTHFRVVDNTDHKVYAYNQSGSYVSSQNFNLNSGNSSATGITWDGTHFRVVDSGQDKVFSYTLAGSYEASADFALHVGERQRVRNNLGRRISAGRGQNRPEGVHLRRHWWPGFDSWGQAGIDNSGAR